MEFRLNADVDPPRTTSLDPSTIAGPTLDVGRPWWQERRPWPPGMRFTDVDPAVLAIERLVDSAPLGPPPAPAGSYGSAAELCVRAPHAEIDLDPDRLPPPSVMIRRRFHPADRGTGALRFKRGAA
jgi:hypothetical protein